MASVRLNIFENLSVLRRVEQNQLGGGSLHFQGVYIPGSISFNNVAMILSASNTASLTISFGLYSLTGSSLSLANSASWSSNFTATSRFWITLVTSATQDIIPGNWWFAFLSSKSSNVNQNLIGAPTLANFDDGVMGGLPIRGYYSATTDALPSSIATSEISKEGGTTSFTHTVKPYILIAA